MFEDVETWVMCVCICLCIPLCLAVILLVLYVVRLFVGLVKNPMEKIRKYDDVFETIKFLLMLPLMPLVALLVNVSWVVGVVLLPLLLFLYMSVGLIRLARKFIHWRLLEKIDEFFEKILESEIVKAEKEYVLLPVVGIILSFVLLQTCSIGCSRDDYYDDPIERYWPLR